MNYKLTEHYPNIKIRSQRELSENEEAIRWLGTRGLTAHEIAYLRWQQIDQGTKTIKITREGKHGLKSYLISYDNSPLVPVINRGQEGKCLWVITRYHAYYKCCGFQPPLTRYSEEEIIYRIREKSAKKSNEMPGIALTIKLMCDRIRLSQAHFTS